MTASSAELTSDRYRDTQRQRTAAFVKPRCGDEPTGERRYGPFAALRRFGREADLRRAPR